MSDDWEDWEEEDFAPAALKTANAQSEKTKGDLLLAKHKEVDTSKFAGEDEGEEEEPKWKSSIPQTQDVSLSFTNNKIRSICCQDTISQLIREYSLREHLHQEKCLVGNQNGSLLKNHPLDLALDKRNIDGSPAIVR